MFVVLCILNVWFGVVEGVCYNVVFFGSDSGVLNLVIILFCVRGIVGSSVVNVWVFVYMLWVMGCVKLNSFVLMLDMWMGF